MLYLIIRFVALVLYKVLFRLQVFGRSNIPLKGGFILAGNHTSYLDPPALGVACPRVVSFLATEGLFQEVLFGRFISALNAFPLKAHSGDLRALRWAIAELRQGRGLTVFPEGVRVAKGEAVEPMEGVGFLAVKTGVPIVPAFIKGSNEALPIDSKFIRLKKIKVYFAKPFWPEELSNQLSSRALYQAIATRTMEEIKQLKDSSN